MKRTTTTLFLLCLMLAGYSQVKLDYSATPKTEAKGFTSKGLSSASAFFLYELQEMESATDPSVKKDLYAKLQDRYGIMQGKVSALIVLADGRIPEELAAYDVTIGSSAGSIYTVRIPIRRFAELAASGICKNINVGEKMESLMDKSRENLGIDQIHVGLHLPHGYDGTGVVVGIIDQGMEFCHPSYYDAAGNIRVKRVWNQWDSTGTAPSGYDYGSEYTTENQMRNAGYDIFGGHGGHVAGIAAGSGAPSGDGTAYKGIAPGADLVLVPSSFNPASVCDAINYIHHYAQSVGKPCVINMSFGSIIQPHDGLDESGFFLTSYVNEHPDSLVLVASSGNDGFRNVHIGKQFSPDDTILTTLLDPITPNTIDGLMVLYGENNYKLALSLINTNTNQQEDFSGFYHTDEDTMYYITLLASDSTPVYAIIYTTQDTIHSHPHNATIKFRPNSSFPSNLKVILTVICNSEAEIHGWNSHHVFSASEFVEGSVDGDSWYTSSGNGVNTDAVISVGSYATRLHYVTYDGIPLSGKSDNVGDISMFSSKGPTADGRVKPDIAAPGEVIIAPLNRNAIGAPKTTVYDTIEWNGDIEYYCGYMGTSMASPMVTGIVALWLQENPSLGVDSVRAILHRTARNDQYTGDISIYPNSTWGHGKVNAFGGLPVNTNLYLVTACAEVDSMGSVNGGGVVTAGTHTLTAVPNINYAFVAWEDGSTDNPRTVYVTCDTFFLATFEATGDSVAVSSYAAESSYHLSTQGLQFNITNAEGHSLSVYDITGRLIVSSPNANGAYRLPSTGVYILQVEGFKPRKVMVN